MQEIYGDDAGAIAPPVPVLSGAPLTAGRTARRSDSKVRLMIRSFPKCSWASVVGRTSSRAPARGAPCALAGGCSKEFVRAARPQDAQRLRAPTASRRAARRFSTRRSARVKRRAVVSTRLAQRAHGQSLAHRRFDLAARNADVPQGSIVEPMEIANGAAQASTRGQVLQHPGAAHRGNAEPLGERMQGAAQAGLDDEGALDAGPPLAFDEGRQRKGIDSLGHDQPPARPSAPSGRARPQSGSKLLSTRAVQAAARQRMAGYVAATGKNGLKQTGSFLGDFLEISNADAVREVSWGRFGTRRTVQ